MALATRCPHCQTTFRVAHDQLKLRAGLVRCGACKEIFNGVDNLVRREENGYVAASPATLSTSSSSAPSTPALPETPAPASAPPDTPATPNSAPAASSAPALAESTATPDTTTAAAQTSAVDSPTAVETDATSQAPAAAESAAASETGEPAETTPAPPGPETSVTPATTALPATTSVDADSAATTAPEARSDALREAASTTPATTVTQPGKHWPRTDVGATVPAAAPATATASAIPWPVPRQATPQTPLPLPQKPSAQAARTMSASPAATAGSITATATATANKARPAQAFFVKEETPGMGRGHGAGNTQGKAAGARPGNSSAVGGGSSSGISQFGSSKNASGKMGSGSVDPMLRMTLLDLATIVGGDKSGAASTVDNGDALNRAMDELRRSPWRGLRVKGPGEETDFLDVHDEPEPEFVQRARRQQRFGRMLRTGLLAGVGLLAVLLFIQTTLYYRNQIAARLPGTAPGLTRLCNVLGCTVGLPAQIESVTIESSELQVLSSSQNTYALVALLRNRSSVNQSWPAIELTINDNEDRPSVRRVFAPADYLSAGQTTAQGLLSNSEQPVRLVLTLLQGKAAGYRVYLFYP